MASPVNMRPGGPRPWSHGALALWLILAAVPAAAQVSPLNSQTLFYHQAAAENVYGGDYLAVDGGLIYSDNVERSATGSGDTLLLLGLSGNTRQEGARLDYHLSSNLALLKYFSGAFPTRPTGFLDGLAGLKIVPGFFSWIVRETYSQVQINLYAPVTPENLVSLNYITTGPRFTVQPTLRTSVRLDALYSYVNTSSVSTQYTNFDNHRYGGVLDINRAFSEAASLYLKANYEKVEFKDQAVNNNFSIGEAEGGYKFGDSRTVFDISGGYSQLRAYDVVSTVESPGGSRQSKQTETFEEPIWQVSISRLITPFQRLSLSASQRFADTAAGLRLGFDEAVPTVAPTQFATGNPFKTREFGLGWRLQGTRTSLDIGALALRQRYVIASTHDYDSKSVHALLTRELSPVMKWAIGASYQHQNQAGPGSTGAVIESSKVWTALTDLNWRVGERLSMRFIFTHSSWSGVYSDNQIGVIASWALISKQVTAPQGLPALSPISPVSTRSH